MTSRPQEIKQTRQGAQGVDRLGSQDEVVRRRIASFDYRHTVPATVEEANLDILERKERFERFEKLGRNIEFSRFDIVVEQIRRLFFVLVDRTEGGGDGGRRWEGRRERGEMLGVGEHEIR